MGTDARHIGLVTIGQAPREDIAAVLRPALGDTPLAQAGALDELDEAQVAGLAPAGDDYPLVSRLRDGTQVVVGKRPLLPYLSAAVARVADGAAAVAVLCSGSFPELETPVPVVLPEEAIHARLARDLDGGRLGVVAPLPGQAAQEDEKWGDVAPDLVATSASPYGPDDAVREAGAWLAERRPSLVLLDCMGFVERHRALVASQLDVPVVSACSVLADTLAARSAR